MTRRSRKRGRGALHIIAGLLLASGLLRLSSTGQAIAENKSETAQVMAANATGDAAPRPMALPATDNAALLEAFKSREERLRQRETALADRMQALQIAEREAAEQIAALTAAEETLSATIALAEVAAENDLETLTSVYANMKPKDAAALFEQMTPDFAAGFLGLMDPASSAQIMTLVSPEVAYSISVVLAGRNANVPTR